MLPFLSPSQGYLILTNKMVFIVYPIHNYNIEVRRNHHSPLTFGYHLVSCMNVIPSPPSHHINSNYSQATGLKGEIVAEQAAKRPKTSMASDVSKLASPQSSDADLGMTSPHAETTADKNKQLVNTVSQSPKAITTMRLQESTGLKQPIQPLVPVNRYKLDNRPTAFRIIPPLPAGLANVSLLYVSSVLCILKENFEWFMLSVLLVFYTIT